MKLNVKAFALTAGIFWGLTVALMTILSLFFGYGTEMLNLIKAMYPYYEISYVGALIGLVWGFFDGAIACAIFAMLYNAIAGKSK